MTSSYLERNKNILQKTMNIQMIQGGNETDRVLKTRRNILKMGQMIIMNRWKGTSIAKLQLNMIATHANTP